jgi:hypothetical protein
MSKAKPILNPAEVLIDRFLDHHMIAPTARTDFINAYKDVLGVSDAETGWSILEHGLEERPHLRSADRIIVPYGLAEAAFGAAPTLKARGELLAAVGQDTYMHTARLWGATASNLRPGKPPADDDADEKIQMAPAEKPAGDTANPFAPDFKGDRHKAIAKLIVGLGTKAASKMAAAHGVDLAARPLSKR